MLDSNCFSNENYNFRALQIQQFCNVPECWSMQMINSRELTFGNLCTAKTNRPRIIPLGTCHYLLTRSSNSPPLRSRNNLIAKWHTNMGITSPDWIWIPGCWTWAAERLVTSSECMALSMIRPDSCAEHFSNAINVLLYWLVQARIPRDNNRQVHYLWVA